MSPARRPRTSCQPGESPRRVVSCWINQRSPHLTRRRHDEGRRVPQEHPRTARRRGGAPGLRHLARLAGLDFQRQNIGDAGLRTLLSSPHLSGLRELDLSYNRLTDAGARALADSPYLARLTALNLGYNALSLAGVRLLYESPH